MRIIFLIIFSLVSLVVYPQKAEIPTENNILAFKTLFYTTIEDGGSCYRIPSLITAQNGDLVAAIDQRVGSCGDLKWNNDINIVIRRSSDNGSSWSEVETVVDYPKGQSASDPSMIVDKVEGAIFLFFNYMDLDKEKDVYYLKVIKSVDNGKTWSPPSDITSQITKPEWHNNFKFITSGRGIQTNSGKLIHTLVNLESGLYIFGSNDHGKTWYFIDNSIQPANESKIIELIDGTWMVNSRVNGKGFRFVHTSDDEGATWLSRPDSLLIDPGCNASIIRYSSIKDGADKNRLVFANANMKEERKNMTMKISYDEGKTWSDGKTIYSGSSAYSSMCITSNGDIGLLFEKDNYQENVFVCVTLEWLTDGKDKYKKNQ